MNFLEKIFFLTGFVPVVSVNDVKIVAVWIIVVTDSNTTLI